MLQKELSDFTACMQQDFMYLSRSKDFLEGYTVLGASLQRVRQLSHRYESIRDSLIDEELSK